jgi:hypothetical protein
LLSPRGTDDAEPLALLVVEEMYPRIADEVWGRV